MKNSHKSFCNYLGALLGFVGALLMVIAIGEMESGTYFDESCTGLTFDMTPEQRQTVMLANGNTITDGLANLMDKCGYHPVGLKHPYLNLVGIVLISAGFALQFYPALSPIKQWCSKRLWK